MISRSRKTKKVQIYVAIALCNNTFVMSRLSMSQCQTVSLQKMKTVKSTFEEETIEAETGEKLRNWRLAENPVSYKKRSVAPFR